MLCLPFGHGQFYGESGAFTGFGFFYKNFPVVVLLDDAFGEGKTEAPTAGFGGIAGVEHRFEFAGRNPFSSVFNVHTGEFSFRVHRGSDGAFAAFHGINGIADEVFEYPIE